MLKNIISSKTRRKLLIKFFVNIANRSYLNSLADEFDESTNSVRKELNNLTNANYLISERIDNKVYYNANVKHPLFNEIQSLVKKYLGIEKIIDTVLKNIGDVQEIYLLGDYAEGKDNGQIDVLLVGNKFDNKYIKIIEKKISKLVNRKVIFLSSNSNKVNLKKLLVFSL